MSTSFLQEQINEFNYLRKTYGLGTALSAFTSGFIRQVVTIQDAKINDTLEALDVTPMEVLDQQADMLFLVDPNDVEAVIGTLNFLIGLEANAQFASNDQKAAINEAIQSLPRSSWRDLAPALSALGERGSVLWDAGGIRTSSLINQYVNQNKPIPTPYIYGGVIVGIALLAYLFRS